MDITLRNCTKDILLDGLFQAWREKKLLAWNVSNILKRNNKSLKEKWVYDLEKPETGGPDPVLILGHFVNNYVYTNGEYSSVNGIPRVMRQIIRALNLKQIPVVVTSFDKDAATAHGFYASVCGRPELIKVMPVPRIKKGLFNATGLLSFNRLIDACVAVIWSSSSRWFTLLVEVWRRQRKINSVNKFIEFITAGLIYVISFPNALMKIFKRVNELETIATDPNRWRYAIVPHYFLFPEALDLKTSLLAYIPDYMPHFFRDRNYFPEECKQAEIGEKISLAAKFILTNSRFSEEYLPDTALKVPREKIISFLMPYLNSDRNLHSDQALSDEVVQNMTGKKFIFYPTQPQPNKRLDLLIESWKLASEAMKEDELYLVLTTLSIPDSLKPLIIRTNISNRLFVFPNINDTTLFWLYQHAVCLGFSSEMEGNFPTQVLEALINDCPIVCMEHPLIRSELGEDSRFLLTAPFGDVKRFAECILNAMNHREEVLVQQRLLKEKVLDRFKFETFAENIWKLDDLMVSEEKPA